MDAKQNLKRALYKSSLTIDETIFTVAVRSGLEADFVFDRSAGKMEKWFNAGAIP
ncbi:MAG: hypothetical protein HC936_04845 [Leptolyngbyaceae cyanobacterium SU_3_3]|nr:hypothetical protein [Leptolyngbyaceae cyanobacterium SU_3_3]NJR50970.1 hypothetical protein [Leptolyngbyaceae cyanobacterium CSU_1_3]